MAAALDKLLPADDAKPSLRRRPFSGLEPKGEPSKLGAQDVWIYKACQAHQCSTTNLVVMYHERDQRMVARLQSQCELSWLGDPLPEERALIEARVPIDLKDENRAFDCPKDE